MSWLGKILGFIFGFMILGPIGGLLGIFLGHMFDSNFSKSYAKANPFKFFGALNKTKKLYFYSLFSCIGHLSKVDGRVSEHEIKTARDIMRRLKLNQEQTKAAMDAFNAGKSANFNIHFYLKQLKEQSHGDKNLARMFMEFQIEAAYSDADLSNLEMQLLLAMAYTLGINKREFDNIHKRFRAQFEFRQQFEENSSYWDKKKYNYNNQSHKNNNTQSSHGVSLSSAYALLNVKSSDDATTVKRAYRKQMNQYHPDKLVAKGLPDDLMKAATEKAQNIKAAYEIIKQSKGWK